MLACITTSSKAIPSLLIYKGSNADLQTSWVENVIEEAFIYFPSSENQLNRLYVLILLQSD